MNPETLRFIREVVRPMAERFRALKAETDDALINWFSGINADVPNDATPVDDGREAEGVSRLVGSDVHNLVTQMAAFQAQLNQSDVDKVIEKPCVRSLEVTR